VAVDSIEKYVQSRYNE
jgi:hypothetical protein